MVGMPLRVSLAMGEKMTWIRQNSPGRRLVLPNTLCLKSALMVIWLMINVSLSLFLSVISCLWLKVPTICGGKTRLGGSQLRAGPVSVFSSGTVWGLPGALSLNLRLALRILIPVAEKAMLTEQVAPGAILAPWQVSAATTKSPAFGPVKLTSAMTRKYQIVTIIKL
jgi:hypothetical protein